MGILAHCAQPSINEVFASQMQAPRPKLGLASIKEEVQPNYQRSTPWPGAGVVYQIHPDIGCPTSHKCKLIKDAILYYEMHTCVRFKERSGEKDYVDIKETPDKPVCSTFTGRIGGAQTLELGTKCWHKGNLMHELGHSVGLPDETTRPDRDTFVEINYDNINPDNYFTFRKEIPAFPMVFQWPFDYSSIMMYGPNVSAMDSKSPTLIPKIRSESLTEFWDKNVLSHEDKLKISTLYQCRGTDQDPDFPFDVKCIFDNGNCGFKNLDNSEWSRRAAGRRKDRRLDSYFRVDFNKDNHAPARLASVNFHGLSPLDKVRGPHGCVSFSYYISSSKRASLKLSKMKLCSPHQLEYAILPKLLWVKSETKLGWTSVSIPVRVTKPFALVFEAEYKRGTTDGAIGMDEFELSYSPCKNPTDFPPVSLSFFSNFSAWSPFSHHQLSPA